MGFAGLRVLSLESRRAEEIAKLIANNGGVPVVAPSMREVPLESNTEAVAFAKTLLAGRFDMVIFLTGVGTRILSQVVETVHPVQQFVDALKQVTVVARGPKPVAVLRELGVPISVAVPEPNTWREILNALRELPLHGQRVAVQEYGVPNPELLSGLEERGAQVTRVPVYQWALPKNTGPLRSAIQTAARGEIDVAMFTTSVQVSHLFRVAAEMNLERPLRQALARIVVASIGPTTTEALREHGIEPDLEPSHPKMGFLVKETADRCSEILAQKRERDRVQASRKSLPR